MSCEEPKGQVALPLKVPSNYTEICRDAAGRSAKLRIDAVEDAFRQFREHPALTMDMAEMLFRTLTPILDDMGAQMERERQALRALYAAQGGSPLERCPAEVMECIIGYAVHLARFLPR